MGYCTDYQGRLCCDSCGKSGGVRKRKCAYKVTGDTLRSKVRHSMHYCPAPALCSDCYKREGGLRGVHGDRCREGAAISQARYDHVERLLDAGESFVIAAFGAWHESVPTGWVGVLFMGREGETECLVKDTEYGSRGEFPRLSQFNTAKGWNK